MHDMEKKHVIIGLWIIFLRQTTARFHLKTCNFIKNAENARNAKFTSGRRTGMWKNSITSRKPSRLIRRIINEPIWVYHNVVGRWDDNVFGRLCVRSPMPLTIPSVRKSLSIRRWADKDTVSKLQLVVAAGRNDGVIDCFINKCRIVVSNVRSMGAC